jgi:hypothetical protein
MSETNTNLETQNQDPAVRLRELASEAFEIVDKKQITIDLTKEGVTGQAIHATLEDGIDVELHKFTNTDPKRAGESYLLRTTEVETGVSHNFAVNNDPNSLLLIKDSEEAFVFEPEDEALQGIVGQVVVNAALGTSKPDIYLSQILDEVAVLDPTEWAPLPKAA